MDGPSTWTQWQQPTRGHLHLSGPFMSAARLLTIVSLVLLVTTMGCDGQRVNPVSPTVVHGSPDSCYCLEDVLKEDLYSPVNVVFYRDTGTDKEHVMVVEQRGEVSDFTLDRSAGRRSLLDIRDRVVTSSDYGESRGLLSAVPDPQFQTNGRLLAYYIRKDDGEDYAYVSMFETAGGGGGSSEKALLRVHQPFVHGNGGPMLFGADGYLYVVTGDGGEDDDPKGYAQDKGTFHGKVLRLDVGGPQDFTDGISGVAKLYAVPEDNPFVGEPDALPEVWALGFRNMWGCSQDSLPGGSNKIFCAETGTDQFDEINVIEPGKNYGWNVKEGNACHKTSSCGPVENEGVPVYNFAHNRSHALVGGYVYRGKDFTWMQGQGLYTFGDVISGATYILKEDAGKAWTRHDWPVCTNLDLCPGRAKARPLQHLLAFGQDTSGELYLVMTKDLIPTTQTAKLFKIVPNHGSSIQGAPQLVTALLASILVLYNYKHLL